MSFHRLVAAVSLSLAGLLFATSAEAMTTADCSAKYQAAKAAGTLNGMKWNDFQKAECAGAADTGAGDTAQPATTTAKTTKKAPDSASAGADTSKGLTTTECSAKYQAAKSGGTLNGMKWNDFRKAECGPGASAD